MKQDECIVSFRLYSGVKVICKAKWGIGDVLLKSSFSEQMAQVASTGVALAWTALDAAADPTLQAYLLQAASRRVQAKADPG
jgi:hypothetical protein